jgi:hypothetical protein
VIVLTSDFDEVGGGGTSDSLPIAEGVLAKAKGVIDAAAAESVAVRLLGGVAVYARASAATRERFCRPFADFDTIAHRRDRRVLKGILGGLGYVPDKPFNAAHGDRRLLFFTADGADHLDIFLDVFEMSHTLDLGERLEVEALTLPAADVLLTKLQVVELNLKDARDVVMLLADHELGDRDGAGQLNLSQVAKVCGDDWGWYTTFTDNLEKLRTLLPSAGLSDAERPRWEDKIDTILDRLATSPKSLRWRVRAKVGRRKQWYRLPEESIDEDF